MKNLVIITSFLILLSSCATVKFYDDAKLGKDHETGLEFFSPKPYLLVENVHAKDSTTKSSIIYLPNLSEPRYAKLRPGIGTTDLKISLQNGMLTSYGIVTDTKIPETLKDFSGIIASLKSKMNSEGVTLDSKKSPIYPTLELFEIIIVKDSTTLKKVQFSNF